MATMVHKASKEKMGLQVQTALMVPMASTEIKVLMDRMVLLALVAGLAIGVRPALMALLDLLVYKAS